MKLGKAAPKFHPKTLSFAKYCVTNGKRWTASPLPAPASKVYREYKIPEQAKLMFGNDQYGCCVWAMIANYIILTSVHTGKIIIPTLNDVLGAYAAVTGFNRTTGENDNGTSMTDALAYMVTTGMAGVKFLAWAQIDQTDRVMRELGTDLFGATLTGVLLPDSAQAQFSAGQSWEVVSGSKIEGGHAILRPGYGALGDDYVSWAKWDQKASLAWSGNVDEEYVVISPTWLDSVRKSTPSGIDLATLEADLKALSV
jgi:hypothetical protein